VTASGVPQTLIESWNGTSWSIVPNPTVMSGYLDGVSCVSATACIVAGYDYGRSGVPRTLIESWNGASWSIMPSPGGGTGFSGRFLNGVSCISATACTAAGDYRNTSQRSTTLIVSGPATG
jgi:hypothetical protein